MKHILIIEDEPSIVENIRYALETEGFSTSWHSQGKKGLERLEQGGVDLVLLDIGLPDVNGIELCKQIRFGSQVPVIFLTARSDEIDRVVGLEIGADDYMVKPFSPRELSARVKAVLRRYDGVQASGSQVAQNLGAGFELDETRCRIFFNGQVLDLSRYEFKILSLLIRHPGRVYSREMLMDLVWDDPEMSTDRAVDAQIKNLRAKLRRVSPHNDPIKTHRGMGYSLKEEP
ncbi:two-component system response regulator CreB [uncultured Desulfobacter sp.]|uniref:two-component system response regulator CreB n=1 Tax=uncultured Desulfobacter sp. TaxID=240139 RepID=UPI0029F55D6B|nr:two-component system response regulator CreB [uncultured Desulfobacter sp.]